jgi:hypothetical protein
MVLFQTEIWERFGRIRADLFLRLRTELTGMLVTLKIHYTGFHHPGMEMFTGRSGVNRN